MCFFMHELHACMALEWIWDADDTTFMLCGSCSFVHAQAGHAAATNENACILGVNKPHEFRVCLACPWRCFGVDAVQLS